MSVSIYPTLVLALSQYISLQQFSNKHPMCTPLPQSPCFRNLTMQNLTESIIMYSAQLYLYLYNNITHITDAYDLCPPSDDVTH